MAGSSVRKLIGILIAVVAGAFLTCGVVMFAVSGGFGSYDDSKSFVVTATPDSATADSADIEDTTGGEAETKASDAEDETEPSDDSESGTDSSAENMPLELAELLSQAGYDSDYPNTIGAGQLVVVNSNQTSAEVSFFEKTDEGWSSVDSLKCQGYVGIEGTVTNMSEQVSGSPKGMHAIGDAFYQYDAPETGLGSFKITDQTYWVDDPDSKYYNQRVEGTGDMDWSSAEKMSDISGYKYGFVINYNMPAEYNKGSAVFFHIGYGPTQGCVAVSEEFVLAYLSKLDAAANPYILII